jgi:hypothetical protein
MVCDAQGEYAQVGYIGSNTANQITVEGVINGLGGTTEFYPVPVAGWKFYLGLIEMRWGPKKFDFEDPDIPKKVWDIYCVTSSHNEDDPPFVRLYRGFEHGYDSQVVLSERTYLDRTKNQMLLNKTHAKMEPCPRWGMSWYDRSYDQTVLHSLTVAFNFVGKSVAEEQ